MRPETFKTVITATALVVAFPFTSAAQTLECSELDGDNPRHASRAIECVGELSKAVSILEEQFNQPVLPSGIVVASFTECSEMPGNWSEVEEARGRMILGANPNRTHGLASRPIETTGGEETVALQESHLPPHSHSVVVGNTSSGRLMNPTVFDDSGGNSPLVSNQSRRHPYAAAQSFTSSTTGGGARHENMPPYIALYFCRLE